jgi:hypothetical protein
MLQPYSEVLLLDEENDSDKFWYELITFCYKIIALVVLTSD